MDIGTLFRISGSALGAQRQRLQTVAENLAGAEVTNTGNGQPYQRQDTVFESFSDQLSKAQGGGKVNLVKAHSQADDRPCMNVYKPGHPDADDNGYVKMPNVNTMEEMSNMISASRSYEANVKVIESTKTMAARALAIGR